MSDVKKLLIEIPVARRGIDRRLTDEEWLEIIDAIHAGKGLRSIHDALRNGGVTQSTRAHFATTAKLIYKGWCLAKNIPTFQELNEPDV